MKFQNRIGYRLVSIAMTAISFLVILLGTSLLIGQNSARPVHSLREPDQFLIKPHGDEVINITAGRHVITEIIDSTTDRSEPDSTLEAALQFIRKPDDVIVTKAGLFHALRPKELGGRSGFSPQYHHVYDTFSDFPDEAFNFTGPWQMSLTLSNVLYERKESTCFGPFKPDGICGGGLENATIEKTSGRWSYHKGPVQAANPGKIFLHKTTSNSCYKVRRIEGTAALFLSTMYFDHPSGNHFHWLGDGLLHLFAGLVDAGLIDPKTNTITEVFTLFILNPTRHYGNVPPSSGFKEYIRLLMSRCPIRRACRVEYLNDLNPYACVHFSKLHYVAEAVGLDHRNSLDVAPHLNPLYTPERLKAIDKKNLTRVFPGNSRSYGFAPLLRRYFVEVSFCEQESMHKKCVVDHVRPQLPPPPDYFSRGPILIINRNSNRHAHDKIHQGRNQGGLREIYDVGPNVIHNTAISVSARSPLRGRVMEVDLSTMTISSQIRLIHSAAAIVAVHGAGLGNIFWLQRDALVIELTPYKLCDCLYYMSGPFQSLASLVDASYANVCLSRDNMEYVKSNDTELQPTEEMLETPSGEELCNYEGGRYPWLFGIAGIRMSKQQWETILLSKMRKMYTDRLASRVSGSFARG